MFTLCISLRTYIVYNFMYYFTFLIYLYTIRAVSVSHKLKCYIYLIITYNKISLIYVNQTMLYILNIT